MQSGLISVLDCRYEAGSPYLAYCSNFGASAARIKRSGAEFVDGLYDGNIATIIGDFILNPLDSLPGGDYHYVNVNFILATYLLEKLSGLGLGEYLQKNVLGPMKLAQTYLDNIGPSYDITAWKLPNTYIEYYYWADKELQVSQILTSGRNPLEFAPGAVAGCGGMVSTTDDMVRWYQGLFQASDNPVLSHESIQTILKPRALIYTAPDGSASTYYTQGVMVSFLNDSAVNVMYEGGTLGFLTAMELNLKTGTTVAAFTSTKHIMINNVTAFKNVAISKKGSLVELLTPIAEGMDGGDGGAAGLATDLFNWGISNSQVI